jgi:hypothetical protein
VLALKGYDRAAKRVSLESTYEVEGRRLDDVLTMLEVRRRFEVPSSICFARAHDFPHKVCLINDSKENNMPLLEIIQARQISALDPTGRGHRDTIGTVRAVAGESAERRFTTGVESFAVRERNCNPSSNSTVSVRSSPLAVGRV